MRSIQRPRADHGTSQGGGHPAAALGALVVSWALGLAGLAILALNWPETWHSGHWYFLVDTADAFVWGAVGAALLSRTRHLVAWIVTVAAVGGGLAAVSAQWSELVMAHPDLPDWGWLMSAQGWGWVPGTLALILVAPWVVRTGPISRPAQVAVGAGALLVLGVLAARLTDPFPWPDGPASAPFAIRSEWWRGVIEDSFQWQMAAVTLLGLLAAADVARRRVGRAPGDRRGLGWLAVGAACMSATFAPLALPPDSALAADLPVWLTPVLHLVSQLFFPAALLVAVLGQRLWGIEMAVSRATLWALLTGGVVGVYVLLVTVLGPAIPGRDGVPEAMATALVAIGVFPARSWLQGRVDRLVHGQARDPIGMLGHVASGVDRAASTEAVITEITEGLVSSLRLGGAGLQLAGGGESVIVGEIDRSPLEVPLVLRGIDVGLLVVAPRPGERLDRRTLESLQNLAPVVASAAQLLATTAALRESRARISAARDEERRQLRRELHDGLGPALAGVSYGIRAGRNLMAGDPEAAAAVLERVAVELDAQVEEVRSLARNLLPPVLQEAGLEAAVIELAERHRLGGEVALTVEVGELGPLEDDVAGAVYGIVAESVRNVVRHSGAATCRVAIQRDAGHLVASIDDDGTGIDPGAAAGVGLQSMRERAEGVGGTLTIGSGEAGRGTCVVARVPLREEVPA